MNLGWVWTANLQPWLEFASHLVGYDFDDSDWGAIEGCLSGTDSEVGLWCDYPLGSVATVFVAYEPGADEMVSLRIEGHPTTLDSQLNVLSDLCRDFTLTRAR